MKIHLIMVLALLVFAAGCDEKQKAEEEAQNAAQNAKVAEAIKNQKRGAMTKPDDGLGDAKDAKDDDAKKDPAEKTESSKKDGKEDPAEKTETSAKPSARGVLDDAIAKAKSEDKALFVHFTADW